MTQLPFPLTTTANIVWDLVGVSLILAVSLGISWYKAHLSVLKKYYDELSKYYVAHTTQTERAIIEELVKSAIVYVQKTTTALGKDKLAAVVSIVLKEIKDTTGLSISEESLIKIIEYVYNDLKSSGVLPLPLPIGEKQ